MIVIHKAMESAYLSGSPSAGHREYIYVNRERNLPSSVPIYYVNMRGLVPCETRNVYSEWFNGLTRADAGRNHVHKDLDHESHGSVSNTHLQVLVVQEFALPSYLFICLGST